MAHQLKGVHIRGSARAILTRKVVNSYNRGSSIRELAEIHNRSYGFIHRLLSDGGVTMRGRGGTRPRKVSAKSE
jgi:hypothetical protein